ncbi:MAG: hypothetical protein SPE09_07560 [Alloprevotella sp.]|nr:hypothetical protein [Alloprevotella sp.]
MKRSIFNIVTGGILGASLLLGYTSCSDDHFDIKYADASAQQTIWQNIQANPKLSNLKTILQGIKVYTKEEDKSCTISYAELLDQPQTFTFWAPIDGSYDANNYLNKLAEIAELRKKAAELSSNADAEATDEDVAAANEEAAKLIEEANLAEYNLGVQFAQNHIARFNYEGTTGEQQVRLLNGKLCSYNFGNDTNPGTFNGVELVPDYQSIPGSNGTIHVIKGESPFSYNIYEYLQAHESLFANVYGTLKANDNKTFWAAGSVPGAMNEKGEMVYVDSAFINNNELLNESNAQITNEDSLYIAVVPTDAAWNEALEKVKRLYQYGETYKYDYKSEGYSFASTYKFSEDPEFSADFLAEYNPKKKLITSMYFSPSIFPEQYNRDEVDKIVAYAKNADSLISTNRVVYYNPAGKGSPNPLFGDGTFVKASNGIIYPLSSYKLDPSYSFMSKEEVDMTNSYNVGSVKNSLNSNGETVYLVEGDNLNPNVDISGLADDAYRYFAVKGKSTMEIYIPLRNLYSGDYRIKIQALPNNVDKNKAWTQVVSTGGGEAEDGEGEEGVEPDEPEIVYVAQNTRFKAQLISDEGVAIGKQTSAITIEEDAAKYYTLWESITIPKCYVGLPSKINNSFPLLKLTVAVADQDRSAIGKQLGLSIARIVVEPVHPEEEQ